MQNIPVRTVFDVVTDFLADNPGDEDILAYHLPEDLQEKAHDLLERNSQDKLSESEAYEMVDFMRADEMIALLKAKIQIKLKRLSE